MKKFKGNNAEIILEFFIRHAHAVIDHGKRARGFVGFKLYTKIRVETAVGKRHKLALHGGAPRRGHKP